MDPNANLAEQEEIITYRLYYIRRRETTGQPIGLRTSRAARLRELRDALRAWLDKGGFAPLWVKCPKASKFYGR